MIPLRYVDPPTLMAVTTMVMMPRGPIAKRTLSAQPMEMLKNCLVTCSPNNVNNGAKSLTRFLENSSPWKGVGCGLDVLFPTIVSNGEDILTVLIRKL